MITKVWGMHDMGDIAREMIGINAKKKSAQLQSLKVVSAAITQKSLDKFKKRRVRVSHSQLGNMMCPWWAEASKHDMHAGLTA